MSSRPPPEPVERSVRPTIALPRAGLSGAAIAIGAGVVGLLFFGALDARRRALTAPAVAARGLDTGPSEAPPPLYIPPEQPFAPASQPPPVESLEPRAVEVLPRRVPTYLEPAAQAVPTRNEYAPAPIFERPPRVSGGSALVLDTSQSRAAGTEESAATTSSAIAETSATAGRARAGSIANRTTTVPQGTLIPAVLETAFNSTRAGFARALVQRDIRGFDGKRILIPRGSRLIGEYRSDATAGQNRAVINWTRLIRPDGATIAVGSPATDPVGTGGVRAKVNSHFFTRFGGAILQSVLDVGVNLASRSSDSPVIVALPGTVQNTTGTATQPTTVPPTLSVKQGTSVSVFVARDLDFTEVESRQ